MKMRSLVATLVLLTGANGAWAQDPPSADTFEREALKVLKTAHQAKRSVTVLIDGERLAGTVKSIGPDLIVLSNRERATILVRRERIAAIEAD